MDAEVAFIIAFASIVARAKRELVVVDATPAARTLRRLDEASWFHGQLVPHEPKPVATKLRMVSPSRPGLRLQSPNLNVFHGSRRISSGGV
jgi:hypothetical protein